MIEIFRLILDLITENRHDATLICTKADVNGVISYNLDRINVYIAIRHKFGLPCPFPATASSRIIKVHVIELRMCLTCTFVARVQLCTRFKQMILVGLLDRM